MARLDRFEQQIQSGSMARERIGSERTATQKQRECPGCTRKIARLFARERELIREAEHVRADLDAVLLAARAARITYDELAAETLASSHTRGTAGEHVRLAATLRQRAVRATRRRVTAGHNDPIEHPARNRHSRSMENTNHPPENQPSPTRRRIEIIEEWYPDANSPPPCAQPTSDGGTGLDGTCVDPGQLGDPSDHDGR